jgi:hypothetical protein
VTEPLTLIPNKPDKERAAEIKQNLAAALIPIMELLDDAAKDGFEIQFMLAPGPLGKRVIQQLRVIKEF